MGPPSAQQTAWENKDPSARICWHRHHSHALPRIPSRVQDACGMFSPKYPCLALCPLPLPVSPGSFGSPSCLKQPVVPSHAEQTSLCSAPVSTTNNHSSPPLIEALNNQKQLPTPPTKAKLPWLQSTAATHTGPRWHFTKAGLFAWKAAITKTDASKPRPAWIPGSPHGRPHV